MTTREKVDIVDKIETNSLKMSAGAKIQQRGDKYDISSQIHYSHIEQRQMNSILGHFIKWKTIELGIGTFANALILERF